MEADYDIAELMQKRAIADERLTTLIGDRLRPDALSQGDKLPGVWYETTQSTPEHDLSGASGSASSRVRFACVSTSKRLSNQIAGLLFDLFDGLAQQYIDPDETVWVYDCTGENNWGTREAPSAGSGEIRYTRNVDFLINHTTPRPSLIVGGSGD